MHLPRDGATSGKRVVLPPVDDEAAELRVGRGNDSHDLPVAVEVQPLGLAEVAFGTPLAPVAELLELGDVSRAAYSRVIYVPVG